MNFNRLYVNLGLQCEINFFSPLTWLVESCITVLWLFKRWEICWNTNGCQRKGGRGQKSWIFAGLLLRHTKIQDIQEIKDESFKSFTEEETSLINIANYHENTEEQNEQALKGV